MTIAKRVAVLETGLRWAEIKVAAHAFLADPTKADKAAAKQILDDRFAFMQRSFRETPLALNVAYISWGEDGWDGTGHESLGFNLHSGFR